MFYKEDGREKAMWSRVAKTISSSTRDDASSAAQT